MTQSNLDDYIDESGTTESETSEERTESDEPEGEVTHSLIGLQANDPLAFLAAIGTLRTLTKSSDIGTPKLSWEREISNWTPTIQFETPVTRDRLLEVLRTQLTGPTDATRYVMSENAEDPVDKLSNLDVVTFRELLETVPPGSSDEQALATYGTDAYVNHSDIVEFDIGETGTALTRLNVLDFAGPKAYLKSQRKFVDETTRSKLRRTLFETWDFNDDASSHRTMHWSPTDASRGAYTGIDPTNLPSWTMHGANRLAISGSRLYAVVPQVKDSATVGFVDLGDRHVFQYPIWTAPVTLSTVRTLLTHPDVASETPDLEQIDSIATVLRAEIEVNKNYRNLGWGVPVG